MIAGKYPFRGDGSRGILKSILGSKVRYSNMFTPELISLLDGLLNTNPKLRLGSGPEGSKTVKFHLFYKDTNWKDFYNMTSIPPYTPVVTSPYDVSNFDSEFTSEDPILAASASVLSPREQKEFMSFSCVTAM